MVDQAFRSHRSLVLAKKERVRAKRRRAASLSNFHEPRLMDMEVEQQGCSRAGCSADDREITLIPIPERFRLCTPRHTAPNDVRNVLTFLYRMITYGQI